MRSKTGSCERVCLVSLMSIILKTKNGIKNKPPRGDTGNRERVLMPTA